MLKLGTKAFYPESLERGTEEQRHNDSEIVLTDHLEKKQYRIKLMRTFIHEKTKIAEWNFKTPEGANYNRTFKSNTTEFCDLYLSKDIKIFQSFVDPEYNFCKICIDAPEWVSIIRSNVERNQEKEEEFKQAAIEEAERRNPKKRLFHFKLGR